jgi:hypothetical protein
MGQRDSATLRFSGLLAFTAFVLLHTLIVVVHGIPEEWTRIVLGQATGVNPAAQSWAWPGCW